MCTQRSSLSWKEEGKDVVFRGVRQTGRVWRDGEERESGTRALSWVEESPEGRGQERVMGKRKS